MVCIDYVSLHYNITFHNINKTDIILPVLALKRRETIATTSLIRETSFSILYENHGWTGGSFLVR